MISQDSKEFFFFAGTSLLILVILLWFLVFPVHCLAPEYKSSIKAEMNWHIAKNTPYVLGTESRVSTDCSGLLFQCFRRSGVPVNRVTSRDMAMGFGGWLGKDITLDDVEELDLPFFTFQTAPTRIHGHVGIFLESPKSKLLEVGHASASRNVILEPLKGVMLRDISKLRYLSIGDAKP